MTKTFLTTVAAAALLALPATAFELDSRYTDADGDLIADVPSDESQWLDPSTF